MFGFLSEQKGKTPTDGKKDQKATLGWVRILLRRWCGHFFPAVTVRDFNLLSARAKYIKINHTVPSLSYTFPASRQSVWACSRHSWLFADVTSKIRAVRQLSVLAALGQDADNAVLDKVHLFPDGSLPDDVVARLEDLEAQLGQHGGHKVWIGVGEQGHGGHQLTTVEVDDLLQQGRRASCYRSVK